MMQVCNNTDCSTPTYVVCSLKKKTLQFCNTVQVNRRCQINEALQQNEYVACCMFYTCSICIDVCVRQLIECNEITEELLQFKRLEFPKNMRYCDMTFVCLKYSIFVIIPYNLSFSVSMVSCEPPVTSDASQCVIVCNARKT